MSDEQERDIVGPATAIRTVLEVTRTDGRVHDDELVLEAYVTLMSGERVLALLACTPRYLDELVVGFAHNHGLLSGQAGPPEIVITVQTEAAGEYLAQLTLPPGADLAQTKWAKMEWRHSPLGSGQPAVDLTLSSLRQSSDQAPDRPKLPAMQAQALARELQGASPIFAATGAVHAAALAAPGASGFQIAVMRDDVGRHNAVDKIAGWCVLNGVNTADKVLMVTCRISADIVGKAVAMGVPILLSRSAPTFRAIETADRAGLTVLGFARGDRFVAYTHWGRVTGLTHQAELPNA